MTDSKAFPLNYAAGNWSNGAGFIKHAQHPLGITYFLPENFPSLLKDIKKNMDKWWFLNQQICFCFSVFNLLLSRGNIFLYCSRTERTKGPECSFAVGAEKLCDLTQGKEERKQINLHWSLSEKGRLNQMHYSFLREENGPQCSTERRVLRVKEMISSEQCSSR